MTVQHVLKGAPDVVIRLRRSARARRYSLRLSRLDGRVTLTLPQDAPLADALAFAEEKSAWILGHLAARPAEVIPDIGASLPVEGRACRIIAAPRSALRLAEGTIAVAQARAEAGRAPRTVEALLRTLARDRLAAASDRHAAAIGAQYARLTLRDTRSRWGSCTAEGALMYSWRLILAPPEILDYVAAHEVAHLQEMNHGPRFWALVARLMPGYEPRRAWLRRHGEDLHRYRFRGAEGD